MTEGDDHQVAAAPSGWADLRGLPLQTEPQGGWSERACVLLDDTRSGGFARLYADPSDVVEAWSVDQVEGALEIVRRKVAAGHHAAGLLTYEAGAAFEPKLASGARNVVTAAPLLWFGIFDGHHRIDPARLATGAQRGLAHVPAWSQRRHERAVRAALELIRAGDCYQVNLTFPSDVALAEPPWKTYLAIRQAQRSGWGGYLSTGRLRLLSCSPELFFAQDGRELVAKPMKGTAPNLGNAELDGESRRRLRESEKDRAENLMIVDLLRNDLSRVAVPGSVVVPALFDIETYPTVHQMTSTIRATIRQGVDSIDVLRATFPCGSVTGAPKVRAMEIIQALEGRQRGAYTGSLGFLDPDGTTAFNVLIRTLEVVGSEPFARLGLGSAIVADSDPGAEWEECAAKSAFLGPNSDPACR